MRLGYITGIVGLYSETFVTDLLNELIDHGVDISLLCERVTGKAPNIAAVYETGFANVGFKKTRLLRFMDRLQSNKKRVELTSRCKAASSHFAHYIKKTDINVAYVEFGYNAVLVWRALVKKKTPFVVHFHGSDITSAFNQPGYESELSCVFYYAMYLIVASDHMRRLLILLGAPKEKICLVRLDIRYNLVRPVDWGYLRRTPPSVIFVGRFTPKKNPIALLEAMRLVLDKLPNAKISLVGEGELLESAKKRSERLHISNSTQFFGRLDQEKVFSLLSQHWLYAQHSVTAYNGDQEGFGISIAEAAAHGLPVVSTLHNGIPEQIKDEKTGYLVQEYDYELMAEKIFAILNDANLAEKMGLAGKRHIESLMKPGMRSKMILDLLRSYREHREKSNLSDEVL